MDNYRIYLLENNLRQIIIESGLSPAAIYFILDKMTGEMYNLYMQAAQQEFKEKQDLDNKIKEDISNKTVDALNEKFQNIDNTAPQAGQE